VETSAHRLAHSLLALPLPLRWAHSQGVARRAVSIAPLLGDRADVLVQAAVLHDIGYAPAIARSGFHPLDGARYLAGRSDIDHRVVLLVAHHSFALAEAELRGLGQDLAQEFAQLDDPLLTQALVFCDLTTTPDGRVTTPRERICEILERYGPASIVGTFIRSVEPLIHDAVARICMLADDAGIELARP